MSEDDLPPAFDPPQFGMLVAKPWACPHCGIPPWRTRTYDAPERRETIHECRCGCQWHSEAVIKREGYSWGPSEIR